MKGEPGMMGLSGSKGHPVSSEYLLLFLRIT